MSIAPAAIASGTARAKAKSRATVSFGVASTTPLVLRIVVKNVMPNGKKKWALERIERDAARLLDKQKDAALDAIRLIAAGHNDARALALTVLSLEITK
jgi:hypothetical protein